jgi:O-methyltransferase involved in polyketide biosynthesis
MGLGGRRLRWLEVDSAAVQRLKAQLLGELEPVHDRRAVVADITNAAQLAAQLAAAGGCRRGRAPPPCPPPPAPPP